MRTRYARRPAGALGEIPSRQETVGPILDPGAGMIPEWINNYTAALFPFVIGLTSEQIIPANPLRAYVLIQNKSPISDMFVNFGNKADAFNGITIIPRGNFELIGGANGGPFSPNDSIWVTGAAVGLTGVVMEGVLPPSMPRF